MGFIYALICPESKAIRYIGQTKRKLSVRLAQHISRCQEIKQKYNHKEQWLRKLIANNLIDQLQLLLIQEADNDLLNDLEIYWIDYYKNSCDLTNGTIGGSHGPILLGTSNPNYGRKLSEDRIASLKLRIGDKNPNYGNHSKPSNQAIEARRIGMINSDKFQKSRKSDEYRQKISDAQSRTVYILDESYQIVNQYKNATIAAKELGFTRGNITNAIRFKRQIGKQSVNKYWVCYEESCKEILEVSKNTTRSVEPRNAR